MGGAGGVTCPASRAVSISRPCVASVCDQTNRRPKSISGVFGVHALAAGTLDDVGACVVIAARRGDIGTAAIIDVAAFEPGASGLERFLRGARLGGATEAHIHRLAETASERAAIVADLTETAAAAA